MRELQCIRCERTMQNIAAKGQQPSIGLAFHTHGHYGSAFFDPMDGSYIEVSICDECVISADAKGMVYWSKRQARIFPVANDYHLD